jgi:hypothetical protein
LLYVVSVSSARFWLVLFRVPCPSQVMEIEVHGFTK